MRPPLGALGRGKNAPEPVGRDQQPQQALGNQTEVIISSQKPAKSERVLSNDESSGGELQGRRSRGGPRRVVGQETSLRESRGGQSAVGDGSGHALSIITGVTNPPSPMRGQQHCG